MGSRMRAWEKTVNTVSGRTEKRLGTILGDARRLDRCSLENPECIIDHVVMVFLNQPKCEALYRESLARAEQFATPCEDVVRNADFEVCGSKGEQSCLDVDITACQ